MSDQTPRSVTPRHDSAWQPVALDIWDKKYRLKTQDGEPVDRDVLDTFRRVARAIASMETAAARDHWFEQFLWALENGALPAGRIMSNAGAQEHKPATSTINCTVSATIPDSMAGIMTVARDAALTLKAGCGIGYEFSTLRPSGAFVAGAGASTSGPLPFMDIFDAMCKTVSSAGNRRGAQMATFDIRHPDIEAFIKAKRTDGRLRMFNLSCLITDEFISAVREDRDWELVFPANEQEIEDPAIEVVYQKWPITEGYLLDSQGLVACRVYKTIKARRLWDLIMASTYDYAEPGFIMIDRMNAMNNLWWCENIRATNPCGEQPLPPHGACLLGSIDLTRFVLHPFTRQASFDWPRFIDVVRIFTRMLDNVVDINGLPLAGQREEILRKRRHGMGITGLGSALTMMCITYGTPDALAFTDDLCRRMAATGMEYGVELAREKGAAPILEESFPVTHEMLVARPQMVVDGFVIGDTVQGKILMARYSHYLAQFPDVLREAIAEHGCRFTHHTSIAPTGTISLSFGNNCSNGIEPSFAHHYTRNIIREGRKTKESVDVLSAELLHYRQSMDPEASPETGLPDYFVSADSVDPMAHIDMQATAQRWIDSSISKTVNVQSDYPFEAFKELYLHAHAQGCKGCTTFRFNPEVFSGVLVKNEDLKNTTYRFTLEDGTTVELQGSDLVEYDGETHSAANLYDALKDGYYGRL
jgi:ribonucleoside-diphosphate reductase alpha chain